jgi:hypothetical protein
MWERLLSNIDDQQVIFSMDELNTIRSAVKLKAVLEHADVYDYHEHASSTGERCLTISIGPNDGRDRWIYAHSVDEAYEILRDAERGGAK